MLEINMLSARSGDAFHIRIHDEEVETKNVIVDSGIGGCASIIEKLMVDINRQGQKVDLFIITHTDRDHIGGLLKLINEDRLNYNIIDELWINDGENEYIYEGSSYTAADGRNLIDKLKGHGVRVRTNITTDHQIQIGSSIITVLSPIEDDLEKMKNEWKKEMGVEYLKAQEDDIRDLEELMSDDCFECDNNQFNNASIAFLIEDHGKKGLFLGDASSDTILNGLNNSRKINSGEVDFIKIPHHGSCRNTSVSLLENFRTENVLISTNGSEGKPHKRTISRMLKVSEKVNLFCNYPWWEGQSKFTVNDHKKYIETKRLKRIKLEEEYTEIVGGVVIKND